MQYYRLSIEDYIKMPWKNGKGFTYEVAKDDTNCPVDRFNWRISMAGIDVNGPFSNFAGFNRVISVLEGEGVSLIIDGETKKNLYKFEPFYFNGGSQTECNLLSDPVKDFNLIYDPLKCHISFRWINLTKDHCFLSQSETVLLFSTADIAIKYSGTNKQLTKYDSFIVTKHSSSNQFQLTPLSLNQSDAYICLIEISKIISE